MVDAYRKFNIPIKQTSLSTDVYSRLSDRDWLYQQHHIKKKTLVEIANELGVMHDTVRHYFKRQHVRVVTMHGTLIPEQRQKLNDKSFLEEAYQHQTLRQIALSLGVNADTVRQYCKRLGVDMCYRNAKLPHHVHAALQDYNWLYDQHVVQQKPLSLIAQELDVLGGTPLISKYLQQHNIPLTQFRRSVGENEIFEFIRSHTTYGVASNTTSIISPQELDIYIPELKIAIEYCGLYWHSEAHKPNNYHLDKLNRYIS